MAINTTSSTNTPQAGDDTYSTVEDYLTGGGVLLLDVMNNDLGGKAKTLWSIDDGAGNPINQENLLGSDIGDGWETTANGNLIRIFNGQIEYRLGESEAAINAVNALAEGEVMNDTFTYAIRLANGTLSFATVHVNIVGSNDIATISANSDYGVKEAGGVANDALGDPSASGTVTVHDLDAGQNVFQAVAPASLVGTYGSFTFNQTSGEWVYTLNQSKADSLTEGQNVTDSLTVTSFDGTANHTITVNITGSNDNASISVTEGGDYAVVEAGGVANGTLGDPSAAGDLDVSDVDAGQAVFAAPASLSGTYGDFTFVAATGAWTYTLDNDRAATQALNGSAPATDTLTVNSLDGTASRTITVNVAGTNDAPVVTSSAVGSVNENTATSTVVYAATASDADAGDSVTWSLSGTDATAFNIDASGNVRLNASADFEAKSSYSFNVVATDGGTPALSDTHAVTVSVNDVNEAPTAVVLSNTTTDIDENTNTATHTKVANITITDDALGTNVLSLSGTDAASFEIVGNELFLKAGVTLDFESQASYAVNVGVNDAGVGVDPDATQSFTLSVNDLIENHAPTIDGQSFTVREHLINSAVNGFEISPTLNVVASDADADTLTYSLISDNSGGAFALSTSGQLTVGDLSLVDYEGAPGLDGGGSYYSVQVSVSDGQVSSPNATIKVYVTDVTATTVSAGNNIYDGGNAGETVNALSGSDIVFGDGGNDTITGDGGSQGTPRADTLYGGSGDDVLNGKEVGDTLVGGAGSDTFVFNTSLTTAGIDTITDFVSGTDKIHLENTGTGLFNALLTTGILSAGALDIVGAGAAADGTTRIIYDPATGSLSYDADGTGVASAAVQFATLGTTTHPGTVVNTDFVVI
ncbi:VCBS domain-containing protein [Polaromonas sp.]|uniref:VCBS domain-containing protein n=1 Tax=Polaromonas sp. TaxID=1869339 RepID=UPI001D5AEC8B|nr:VCBS domain-containing protein [Polaromonas sp.]MBT9475385.1 VCBS domain-containing protein [Polaromonas sp.]